MSEYVPQRPSRLAVAGEWLARPARHDRTQPDRPFIIVTGAGRSGTSAVARVLHESGVRMGHDLAQPSDANADGFYEDWGALWLNERILRDCGVGDRWQPERWPSRATVRAAARRYRDEMAALVASAAGGWKDPRFSITLEAWLPLLPSRTKVIVCLRSPSAYAESVVRVYGLVDRAAAERQWARHYRRLLDVVREHALEAICIEYDALVEQPEETVAALSAFVGRPLSAAHVSAPLRRYVSDVPERHRALYEQVLRLGSAASIFPTRPPREVVEFGGHPQAPGAGVAPLSTPRPSQELLATSEQVARRVGTASAVWQSAVGMPKLAACEKTRAACERHRSVLCEAQRELAALPGTTRVAREIDLQRMIVELTLEAIQGEVLDQRAMKAAVRAWKRFGRTPALPVG